jgi:LAGLIDADG-like domain
MRASPVVLDVSTLRQMYLDERLSTTEIARRLGCGTSTVTRRLHSLGVPRRRRGPAPQSSRPSASLEWSPEMAWVVGLIATDGHLVAERRRIAITSKNLDLLQSVRRCLALSNRFVRVESPWGTGGYRLQWASGTFYAWLQGIGLTPRKSLTLGPLRIPDEYFADFFRGCIDGDGTILVYTDASHSYRKATYVYTRLYVSLVSASRSFVDWLRATVWRLKGLRGGVHVKWTPRGRPVWVLRFSKTASVQLLRWMYHAPDVPCLARKRARAQRFILGAE